MTINSSYTLKCLKGQKPEPSTPLPSPPPQYQGPATLTTRTSNSPHKGQQLSRQGPATLHTRASNSPGKSHHLINSLQRHQHLSSGTAETGIEAAPATTVTWKLRTSSSPCKPHFKFGTRGDEREGSSRQPQIIGESIARHLVWLRSVAVHGYGFLLVLSARGVRNEVCNGRRLLLLCFRCPLGRRGLEVVV